MNTDDLIRLHADLVYATCLRVTGNAQDAADVSQEVFIAWMQQRQAIRGPLAAWLHATARRRALDWLRRQHRRRRYEQEAPAPVAAAAPDDGWREHLDASLDRLDARSRTLVIEHHLFGLTQEALAERWRVSQATVSRLLARGMEHLRRELSARGVTAAGALLPPGLLPSCPADLHAPLLAQARIGGGAGLAGGGPLGGTVALGALLVGAAALLALALGALLAWRAVAAWRLGPDPVGAAIAAFPPCAAPAAVTPPASGARFRALEALIARLPPMDRERQARIRAWLTKEGTLPAWDRLPLRNGRLLGELPDGRGMVPKGWNADDEAQCRAVLADAAPLFADLDGGLATLNAAGWLAEDYAAGRISTYRDLVAWQGAATTMLQPRLLCQLLALAAMDGDAAALVVLDRLVAAQRRGTCTVIDFMVLKALDDIRDRAYLNLAETGRLDGLRLRKWCREPSADLDTAALVVVGEGAFELSIAEDRARSGIPFRLMEQDVVTASPLALLEGWITAPLEQSWLCARARWASDCGRCLGGDERIPAGPPPQTGPTTPADWPEYFELLARWRLEHAGNRLAAWLIHLARSGQVLPETLDQMVGVVADGPRLAGGDGQTLGLRYERQSGRSFVLGLDPASAAPTFVRPGFLAEAHERARHFLTYRVRRPVTVSAAAMTWRADLDLPAAAPADPPEPPPPAAAQ